MVNPVKGEAALDLADGRSFVLIMDMEALIEAESAYGKPLDKLMKDAQQGFVGASRALLFGALRTKHPDITLRQASAIFLSDGDAVSSAIALATERGFPSVAEGKKGKNPPGANSGGNGAKPASTTMSSSEQLQPT